jgi:hypothetical protein
MVEPRLDDQPVPPAPSPSPSFSNGNAIGNESRGLVASTVPVELIERQDCEGVPGEHGLIQIVQHFCGACDNSLTLQSQSSGACSCGADTRKIMPRLVVYWTSLAGLTAEGRVLLETPQSVAPVVSIALAPTQAIPTPLQGAIAAARRGIPIIALQPRSKPPMERNWPELATTDERGC